MSCPHYFTECLVYLAFALILGPGHTGAVLCLTWVVSNQVSVATLSHRWYQDKFEDYPKERKAIFPYLL